MKQTNKYWRWIKQKSPKILAITGSIGTCVTAYLAAKNEAKYQHERMDYFIEHGMFPEECYLNANKPYKLLGIHLNHHISTFISSGVTVASILYGNHLGEKQNAALLAMNIGIGNAIAKRNNAESNAIQKLPEGSKPAVSKEEVQDYLVHEAYDNDLVFYTSINRCEENEMFVWLDIYPYSKIFVVDKNNVSSLEWFINTSLKEQNYISYGEIFDYLNIYSRIPLDFVDEDINEWIYLFGFSKRQDDELKIEVYSRDVNVDEGVTVTVLSLSSIGGPISML